MRDHLETITNAVEALGGFVENTGGGVQAWRFNLPAGKVAYVGFGDGEVEGDPDAEEWGVSRWGDDGEEVAADGATLAQCLSTVKAWIEGGAK